MLRLRHTDYAASDAAAGISGRLRPIVCFLMDDDSPAENGSVAAKLKHVVFQLEVDFAGTIRLDIAKVTRVPIAGVGGAMRFFHRIKMAAGRGGVSG